MVRRQILGILDPLAQDLAYRRAGVAGAAIDRCRAHHPMFADRAIDGDMRRHLALTQVFNEGGEIVSLSAPTVMRQPRLRRSSMANAASLSTVPGRVSEPRIDRKPVAVLLQNVPHEAQPALAAIRFAIEPRIGEGSKARRDSDQDRDGGSGCSRSG